MREKNVLERLAEVNPQAEIWWDSSPLIYDAWVKEMLGEAYGNDRETIERQINRLHDPEKPEETLFRGVTTNPPLCLNAIKTNEPYWQNFVDNLIDKNRGIDGENLFWITYKEIVRRGAQMFMGVFEKSHCRYGYLSGQVDPRFAYDEEKMLQQAQELKALSPNIMVKVPGTKEGYRVIRILTSRGIATNNTLAFTLPQFLANANAVKEGLEIARGNGVALCRCRSVITHMAARYGELGDLRKEAEEKGIGLSETDVRWAELAIFKKACKILKEKDYPSKMLICSMRIGPPVDGKRTSCWHVEKLAGADIVYTCPPKFIKELMAIGDHINLENRVEEEPPKTVLDKLLRIPYFEKAYTEDGLSLDEFNTHPALLATTEQFSDATRKMVDFVTNRLDMKR